MLKKNKQQEYDFLIFSHSRKLIIGIEAKSKISGNKPFKQLKTYHKLIEERLSDQLGLGWTFFPTLYVEQNDQFIENYHYISKETGIHTWLTQVLNKFPVEEQVGDSLGQLKKVLQIIVFTVHVSKRNQVRPIISSNWVEYMSLTIDTLSTKDTIVFLVLGNHW